MSRKFKNKIAAFAASAVMAATSIGGAIPSVTAADSDLGLDNYAKLLQYSLYFFDANYCGVGAGEKTHFSWRDDCHTDGTANGGFHDAGDGIICGLTEGFSASTLGWLYYEYKDEFQKTGTYAHMKDITDEFAQFFKNCTTLDANGNVTNFIYEVGDDGADHGKWRAPELMQRNSSEYYSTTNGASNVAAQYAAALAQNYINFGNEDDLKYAKALYDFAAKYRTMTYEQATYSDKSVEDDIAWAAGWLYLATNEQPYLDANSKDTSNTNDWINDYYYGGVWLGAAIINAEITGNWDKPVSFMKGKTGNSSEFYYANDWGSARYNTLMQTCAMIATKHKDQSGVDFSEWCKGQMDMVLGKNNANVCLVVGYNDVSATSPHHRAASGLYVGDGWEEWNSWNGDYASVPTSHTLYGALCGGPTSHTDFSSFRKLDAKDATSNEVAVDYQVGLVGAAAGLYSFYGTGAVVDTIGDEVTVYDEEIAVAQGKTPNDTTTTTTETTTTTSTQTTTTEILTTTMTTTTTFGDEPHGDTYTFEDTITDIGDKTVTFAEHGQFKTASDEIFKQIQSAGVGSKVSIKFMCYCGSLDTISTLEKLEVIDVAGEKVVSFEDRIMAITEDTVTFENNGTFNITKDMDDITFKSMGIGTTVSVDLLCLNNNIIQIRKMDIVKITHFGDANEDNKVSIADAVLIMQSLSNPNEYKLSEKAQKNADSVDIGGGITAKDALAIQMIDTKLIDVSDLPVTSEDIDRLSQ